MNNRQSNSFAEVCWIADYQSLKYGAMVSNKAVTKTESRKIIHYFENLRYVSVRTYSSISLDTILYILASYILYFKHF